MTTTTPALAMFSADGRFQTTTVTRRDLRADDVRIDITFAGICHSDIHTVRGEWGETTYPLTPGHEIAGVVSEVGPDVTRFAVGDKVGVGCMVDSCGECGQCAGGHENFCERKAVFTYGDVDVDGTTTQGGYSRQVVVNERFVLRIPDSQDE